MRLGRMRKRSEMNERRDGIDDGFYFVLNENLMKD
jgi:hypothetical protein